MLLYACACLLTLLLVENALKKFGWQSREDACAGRVEGKIHCKIHVSSDSETQKAKENCL